MAERRRADAAGFTYIGILLAVATLGVFLAVVGDVWRTAQQREAERDLRFIGEEFRRAISRYYEATPGAAKMYPRSLQDLVSDNRFPGIRRYLRRIYVDPITLRREWGTVAADDGGVAGVYSLSQAEPLGQLTPVAPGAAEPPAGTAQNSTTPAAAGKPSPLAGAADEERKPRYSDWKFIYSPPVKTAPPPASAAEAPIRPSLLRAR